MNTNANIRNFSKNHFTPAENSPLEEEHYQFSLIINNSEEFLLLIDAQYRIIVCNHMARRLVKERLGFDLKPGDDFFCMISPDKKEEVKQRCDRAFKGEKIESEYRLDLGQNNVLYFHSIYILL